MLSHLGRYSILSKIGSGGMGEVYLAMSDSGRRVALKTVHPHLLASPGFFMRFIREGQLGSKVKHPNVVRTLEMDSIVIDGKQITYMVMEYVRGNSLRQLLRELGTVPETLLREIALQLSAGLGAIHAAGITHRDLKPENVLISRNHTVRIMDLGVAKMQEASVALTMVGQFVGSYLYAAPEQFDMNANVGPSADLYALGVLLYELATGDNPFKADGVVAVMRNHRDLDPPRLHDRAPEISPFFSEVVHRLLSKEPGERFESAAEVNTLLDEAEHSTWWQEIEREMRKDTSVVPTINVRRECALVGREKELRALHQAWDRAKLGEGGVLLFEGEAGIGKTRLLDAFAREISIDDAHILYGAYTPGAGLGGLTEAIIGKFGSVNLAEGLEPFIPETPTLVSSFAAMVTHESAPVDAAELQADALHTIGCHLVRNLSVDKPSVWAIDDLHFAPQESVHLLMSIARAISTQRTLLVMTARSADFDQHIEHFARLDRFRRHELGRLSQHDVSAMLSETLRSDALVRKYGSRIAEKSDGVPLFVLEIARNVHDNEETGNTEDTDALTDVAVPAAVRDLIGVRIKGLNDDDRNLLDCAAVQGFAFEPDLLARALEIKPIQVLQRLAALERRLGIVQAHGAGYRFDHHQIQEVLYAEQPDALRRHYHMLTADAFEARGNLADVEEPDGAAAYFMADHHMRGTTPESARRYLDSALEHVDNEYRNDAHVTLCNRALERLGHLTPQDRCKILIRKAAVHGHLGQRKRQGAAIEEAVGIADSIGDTALRCKARSELGWHAWALGHLEEAQAVYQDALGIVEDDEQRTELRSRLAMVLSTLGHQEEALELEQKSANTRGLCHQYMGRYGEALACFENAVASAESPSVRAVAPLNVGRMQAALGDPTQARATIEGARGELRSMGLRRPESYATHRLGEVAEQIGDEEEATRLYEEALSLRREIAYPSGVAESLLALGRLRRKQGSEDDVALNEAQQIARDIDRPDELVLSAVYLSGGVAAEAALKSHGPRMRVRDRMEAHFELWRATKKAEHRNEAQRLLAHLLEHAPESCREAMLTNVPLHAAIHSATE